MAAQNFFLRGIFKAHSPTREPNFQYSERASHMVTQFGTFSSLAGFGVSTFELSTGDGPREQSTTVAVCTDIFQGEANVFLP